MARGKKKKAFKSKKSTSLPKFIPLDENLKGFAQIKLMENHISDLQERVSFGNRNQERLKSYLKKKIVESDDIMENMRDNTFKYETYVEELQSENARLLKEKNESEMNLRMEIAKQKRQLQEMNSKIQKAEEINLAQQDLLEQTKGERNLKQKLKQKDQKLEEYKKRVEAASEAENVLHTLRDEGTLAPLIIEAARCSMGNDKLHVEAFGSILESINVSGSTEQVIRLGAIPLILDSMESHAKSYNLQIQATRLLWKLAHDRRGKKELLGRDAFDYLLSCLERFPYNEAHTRLYFNICNIFKSLLTQEIVDSFTRYDVDQLFQVAETYNSTHNRAKSGEVGDNNLAPMGPLSRLPSKESVMEVCTLLACAFSNIANEVIQLKALLIAVSILSMSDVSATVLFSKSIHENLIRILENDGTSVNVTTAALQVFSVCLRSDTVKEYLPGLVHVLNESKLHLILNELIRNKLKQCQEGCFAAAAVYDSLQPYSQNGAFLPFLHTTQQRRKKHDAERSSPIILAEDEKVFPVASKLIACSQSFSSIPQLPKI